FNPNKEKKMITTKDIGRGKANENHQIISDLKWLLEKVKKHASIDTLAKKLSITESNQELKKLKMLLIMFFAYEQIKNVDERYDSFIAAIINERKEISNSIRILSWNYDYQFEKAFSEYLQIDKLAIIQEILNIAPSKNIKNPRKLTDDIFEIVKLNGTTAVMERENTMEVKNIFEDFSDQSPTNLKAKFEQFYGNPKIYPLVNFAWESNHNQDYLAKAEEIAKLTSVLVVIGYSFPFFNREIDRKIIRSMTNINKIYIQDINPENIINRLSSIIESKNIIPIKDVEQFYLPSEL
ncbi:MAG: hypothetical protein NTW95_12860, partial [Candidatus Aminicenantes bacterium]|nr:hypothetical protein [Candidatus Aminicenantes bacterium]